MSRIYSFRQLLRQPIKTLFGVFLTGLAVAALVICIGQSVAAEKTLTRLKGTFTPLALPAVDYTEEADAWALAYAAEHPEVVKAVGAPGLAAAYLPDLTPDNYAQHLDLTKKSNRNYALRPSPSGAEYTSAMFEITLTSIGDVSNALSTNIDGINCLYLTQTDEVSVALQGTIDRVIGLAEGYADPTGFTADINLCVESREALDALGLEVGRRYLVYATDYYDCDWALRSRISQEKWMQEERLISGPMEAERLEMLDTEEIVLRNGEDDPNDLNAVIALYRIDYVIYGLKRSDLLHSFRHASFTVCDDSAMLPRAYQRSDFYTVEETVLDGYTCTDENGGTFTMTPEEYHEVYAEPTIVLLEGSAEEFLDSPEGTLWREALDNISVNSKAFPIIGVDDMSYVSAFARSMAEIVQGRSFTAEELAGGAKLCLMSQSLAEANGLSVGDVITPRFYANDPNLPYQINVAQGEGSVNPTAYFYFSGTTPLAEEAEEYTIIGLYKQEEEWCNVDTDLYSFTPNTIFVPKTSVSAEMCYGYAAFFRTFALHGGALEEFRAAALAQGFPGAFFYDDNGYGSMEDSISHYKANARQAMLIGVVVYGILLLLFLLLFPARQGKVLATMESLGAVRKRRMAHVLKSGLGVLIPGTLLGTVAGALLWRRVVDALTAESGAAFDIEMSLSTMAVIAAVQFVLTALLILLSAIPMTAKKSLMKRK